MEDIRKPLSVDEVLDLVTVKLVEINEIVDSLEISNGDYPLDGQSAYFPIRYGSRLDAIAVKRGWYSCNLSPMLESTPFSMGAPISIRS